MLSVVRPARTIRTKSSRWTAVELRGHRLAIDLVFRIRTKERGEAAI
jgi:hypothetical protein